MTLREVTALFIDMLGFAALVEQFPDAVEKIGCVTEDGDRYTIDSPSESAERFRLFQLVLDRFLEQHYQSHPGGRAMLFSDCAFILDEHPLVCALAAVDLMQGFIRMAIPVRMGIAFGTFQEVRSSSDVRDAFRVTRSLFTGTAVARASVAERCGGKGMRIFLHPSLAPRVEDISWRATVLQIDPPYPAAPRELSYLHRGFREQEAEQDDRELFRLVGVMWDRAPETAHVHYATTIAMLNSMRRALDRPEVVLTTNSWGKHVLDASPQNDPHQAE